MVEHLIIGFLVGITAHVQYVKALTLINTEVRDRNSKRRAKRQQRERNARKQRTKINNLVNN